MKGGRACRDRTLRHQRAMEAQPEQCSNTSGQKAGSVRTAGRHPEAERVKRGKQGSNGIHGHPSDADPRPPTARPEARAEPVLQAVWPGDACLTCCLYVRIRRRFVRPDGNRVRTQLTNSANEL